MSKLFLVFLCLYGSQVVLGVTPWDDDSDVDDPEYDDARAIWDQLFNLLKAALNVEALKCQGTVCQSCLSAFGKGGCVKIAYNKQTGANAAIQATVTSGSKVIWSGNLNAGKPVPSCVKLPKPIKEVCIRDFGLTGGLTGGQLCFTINFKSYSLGVKQCAGVTGGLLTGSLPQIIKT